MKLFIYYFWTFLIGSIMGVILESLWCIIKYKKLESRKGLIFGPVNPLYGMATLVLSIIINNVTNQSAGNIFLIGVVIASILEYLCSYYQEKVVGTVSWDYKKFKFNLNGRINLKYSLAWGLITVCYFKGFMPTFNSLVIKLYDYKLLTIILSILYIIDSIISLIASIRRNERRKKIYAHTKFEKHFDYFYDDTLMEKVYPNSVFTEK